MKTIKVNREDYSWFYDEVKHEKCSGTFQKARIIIDEYLIKHISIGITNNCNLKCSYCYKSISSDKCLHEIPYDTIISYIDRLANMKINGNQLETVQLIGGEPTLHKDFLRICTYLKGKGLPIRVSTNGTNTKILQSLELENIYAKHPVEFRISLDDFDINKNTSSRGGDFKVIENNIKFLIGHGANISVKSVITKQNINDIPKILEYLSNLGVKAYSYSTLYNLGSATENAYYINNYVSDLDVFKKFEGIMKDSPEYIPMLQANIIYHILETLFIRKPNYFLTKFYLYVNYDGNIYAQDQLINCDYLLGNIYDGDLDYNKLIDDYKAIKLKKEIRKEGCLQCDCYPYCVKGNYGELYNVDPTLTVDFPTCDRIRKLIYYFIENADVARDFLIGTLNLPR